MEQLARDKVIDEQSRDEVRNQCRSAEAADKEAAARIHGAEAALVEAAHGWPSRKRTWPPRAQPASGVPGGRTASPGAFSDIRVSVAPFDGVISDRQVHTGHYLNAANGSTTGQPLLVVVRMDKVRVFAEVPEADAVRVAARRPAAFACRRSTTAYSWEKSPAPRGRSTRPSGTLRTEIDLPNPEGILRPGMYCHSMIDVEQPGHGRSRPAPSS